MKLPRRSFLHLAAGVAALPAASRIARAESYPTRPVHIVVGFTAGGPFDITARLIGQSLSAQLGQPFIIDNRPGAGTNIATEFVVGAPADGYTLSLVGLPNAINASLYDNLNFDFIRDIAPVASIVGVPNVMLVNPAFPAKTIPEFIAYAKANPGKINMASAGEGTFSHLCGELFKLATGIDLVHVPYKGGAPALTDVLGGHVQLIFSGVSVSLGYIKSGKLRALGVTTSARLELLPDIPTVGESVPGYEANGWEGLGAPKNTPADVIDRLNGAVKTALADPKIKASFSDLGNVPMPMTPAEFGKLIAGDTEKWRKVIRAANIKAD